VFVNVSPFNRIQCFYIAVDAFENSLLISKKVQTKPAIAFVLDILRIPVLHPLLLSPTPKPRTKACKQRSQFSVVPFAVQKKMPVEEPTKGASNTGTS
jgi:hypothetical protein